LKAHIKVIEFAQSGGFNVLVMEDDITICENFDMMFRLALNDLPDDWSLLYLGGNEIIKGEGYSQQLKRVKKMTGGFGVLVSSKIYGELLTLMKSGKYLADYAYMQFQSKAFATWKPLITHKQGRYSEIKQKIVEY
jgi:GR25 family glycosyltransferase involved in LPS biosynthesis